MGWPWRRAEVPAEDCGDIYPTHPAEPHYHVGHPRKKSASFVEPARNDPFSVRDKFVNARRSPGGS